MSCIETYRDYLEDAFVQKRFGRGPGESQRLTGEVPRLGDKAEVHVWPQISITRKRLAPAVLHQGHHDRSTALDFWVPAGP